MMVRKRSNYTLEDYIQYAHRNNVTELIYINENGFTKMEEL